MQITGDRNKFLKKSKNNKTRASEKLKINFGGEKLVIHTIKLFNKTEKRQKVLTELMEIFF